MLIENLKEILGKLKNGNCFGEEVLLVGATKTVDADTINLAVKNGLKAVAENKVQEFREKTPLINGASIHFIGHLQTNKVKYLVGKVELIHSIDSFRLAEEVSKEAQKKSVRQNVLVQINVSGETSKGGFDFENAKQAVRDVDNLPGVHVSGLMTMFPALANENEIACLCGKMRNLYDQLKKDGFDMRYLSMGMSKDWEIAVKYGSNTVRIGSAIFGKRIYNEV